MKTNINSMLQTQFFIGPPAVGKTTISRQHPGCFIDPEDSIDWKEIDRRYGLYPFLKFRNNPLAQFEHEVDWSLIWTKEILPRILAAMLMQKDVVMGMVTPLNIDAVSRFLNVFHGSVKIVIPDEETHYNQFFSDAKNRPRGWGSEFQTWRNAYQTRLLLRGLADEVSLMIVDSVKDYVKKGKRKEMHANRKVIIESGRVFIETFFGRWAELDAEENILAMYNEVKFTNGSIAIQCDKTAKVCGKGAHDCDNLILLGNDFEGRPLSNWIACDKIKKVDKKKPNAVIFFAGTLAPFHHGHLNVLDGAKAFLEAKGWNVIGGYASTFANRKEDRFGDLAELFQPVEHRNAMLQLGSMHSDWLMADFPVQHVLHAQMLDENNHPAQLVVKRLRDCGAIEADLPVTTFWVNGEDGYLDPEFFGRFASHANDNVLNPLRMLIVDNRPGQEKMWSAKKIAKTVPSLEKFVLRYRQRMGKPTSATVIRNAILSGDRVAFRESLGLPLVESYLLGLLHKYVNVKG